MNGIVEMTKDEIDRMQIHLKMRNKRQAHDPNKIFCICSKTSTCSRSDFCACKSAKRECTHLCGCGEPCSKRRMEINKIKIHQELEFHHTRSLTSNQEMLASTNIKFENIINDDFQNLLDLELANEFLEVKTSVPMIENFQLRPHLHQQQTSTTSFYNQQADQNYNNQLPESNFITNEPINNDFQQNNMLFDNNTCKNTPGFNMLASITSENINKDFDNLINQNNMEINNQANQFITNTNIPNQIDQFISNPQLLVSSNLKIEPAYDYSLTSEQYNQKFHSNFQSGYAQTHSEYQHQNNFTPFSSENINERLEKIEKSVLKILQFCEIIKNSNLL
jgi:hypothetical protein